MTNRKGYVAYQLREAQKAGIIASVFADAQNPDDFIAGYVLCVGTKSCVIESINTFGVFDGWFAIKLDCIIEVSSDDQYVQRLMKVAQIDGYVMRGFPDDGADWLEGEGVALMLSHAMQRGRAVTCWTALEACAGYIEQLDDLYATMTLLDFFGVSCAGCKLRLLDIEMVSILSEEELMYEKLNAYS